MNLESSFILSCKHNFVMTSHIDMEFSVSKRFLYPLYIHLKLILDHS